MKTDYIFSSKEEKWQTPQWLFDELDQEFHFTLDPCCQHDSAKCNKYYTPEEDGLLQSWKGEIVFCNPPYGKELRVWVQKCYEESLHKDTTVVLLMPVRTDTTYFHKWIYHKAELRFLSKRLRFVDPVTKKLLNTAPFPSMVVIFN